MGGEEVAVVNDDDDEDGCVSVLCVPCIGIDEEVEGKEEGKRDFQ